MSIPLDTGDRVAWTEDDRGIAVAADPAWLQGGRRLTVAVWRGGRFSGHVARIPAGHLYRTPRLHADGGTPLRGAAHVRR